MRLKVMHEVKKVQMNFKIRFMEIILKMQVIF